MVGSGEFAPDLFSEVTPRELFVLAASDARLRAEILAWAQSRPAHRVNGQHLATPLFSQWLISSAHGWALRVHCFHRDDPDVPHNHAWAWMSLILASGYWDDSPGRGPVWRAVGEVIEEDGARFHRVLLRSAIPAWSLFLRGPDERKWGFLGPAGNVIPRDEFVTIAPAVAT